jgi:DNA gyrase subunit A
MPEEVIKVFIEDEMEKSYLTYAMSVIVSRALPDVRDGLKPVHRRILYSMYEQNLTPERPSLKSARVVGDVLGKYHPHGDQSVYDAMVRMAQDFSMRYQLVNGQGNFGSIDGDSPAAMRYTEAKLKPLGLEMLRDINKNTVDYQPNFDDTLQEPSVMPSAIPNLMINGTTGIAVGMATNMAPHNLTEVINGIIAYIENPKIEIDELIKHIPGPDFPTAGIIYGRKGLHDAYKTGKGRAVVRAKIDTETLKNGREAIIVKEIPYRLNKSILVEKIAELVKDKKIEGIADLRDESDRNGIRIVIELKKNAVFNILLNNLYKHTHLQSTFSINNLALVNGMPKRLNLKQLIKFFVRHRKEVIIRRSKYDLDKAEKRAHILEGLLIALDKIDEVIALIRASDSPDEAKKGLVNTFGLTDIQASEILQMRLSKLTALERDTIKEEYKELVKKIKGLKELLASDEKQYQLMIKELTQIKEKYGDERRTEILDSEEEGFDIEDLIKNEECIITISHGGYIKRVKKDTYNTQARGGKGVTSTNKKVDDFIEQLFIANTHDYLMFITNFGRAFYIKVHEIPESSRTARGKSIKLMLRLEGEEEIRSSLPLKEFSDNTFIVMVTKKGVIKRCVTKIFQNAKSRGIIGVNLDEGDNVVSALITNGKEELMLYTRNGKALRFLEDTVRVVGRSARGVRGMRLKEGDYIIAISKIYNDRTMLILTDKGYGKRTEYNHFNPHGRATAGQIYIKCTPKTGKVATVLPVSENDDIMIITQAGMVIKVNAKHISKQGRTARGVRVISVKSKDKVVDGGRLEKEENTQLEEEIKS